MESCVGGRDSRMPGRSSATPNANTPELSYVLPDSACRSACTYASASIPSPPRSPKQYALSNVLGQGMFPVQPLPNLRSGQQLIRREVQRRQRTSSTSTSAHPPDTRVKIRALTFRRRIPVHPIPELDVHTSKEKEQLYTETRWVCRGPRVGIFMMRRRYLSAQVVRSGPREKSGKEERTHRTGFRGPLVVDSSCGRTTSGNLLYRLRMG
jgi:hypothetical protein